MNSESAPGGQSLNGVAAWRSRTSLNPESLNYEFLNGEAVIFEWRSRY
jgi:hypothetical protein